MEAFSYSQDRFAEAKKQTLTFTIFFFACLFIGSILSQVIFPEKTLSLSFVLFQGGFYGLLAFVSCRLMIRTKRRQFDSFRVMISKESITRTENGLSLTILIKDIATISKRSNGAIVIKDIRGRRIAIEPFLENGKRFEEELASIHPIQHVEALPLSTIWLIVFFAVAFSLLIVVSTTGNHLVRTSGILLLAALLFYGFISIQQNSANRILKYFSWALFIPMLAFVYYLIFG